MRITPGAVQDGEDIASLVGWSRWYPEADAGMHLCSPRGWRDQTLLATSIDLEPFRYTITYYWYTGQLTGSCNRGVSPV